MVAKVWLNPVRLAVSQGFGRKELNTIVEIVDQNQARFAEAWDEFFAD